MKSIYFTLTLHTTFLKVTFVDVFHLFEERKEAFWNFTGGRAWGRVLVNKYFIAKQKMCSVIVTDLAKLKFQVVSMTFGSEIRVSRLCSNRHNTVIHLTAVKHVLVLS